MTTTRKQKSQWRQLMQQRRQALSDAERQQSAAQVLQILQSLPELSRTQHIGLYLAHGGELPTLPIAQALHEQRHHLFLPVITGKSLVFRQWYPDQALTPNQYGIGEPPTTATTVPVSALDSLLMPLVGFNRQGARLGMGGGYYDRALADAGDKPTRVGLAYAFQELPELRPEAWDMPLDQVITDQQHIVCKPA